jgi:hypothetical protein
MKNTIKIIIILATRLSDERLEMISSERVCLLNARFLSSGVSI